MNKIIPLFAFITVCVLDFLGIYFEYITLVYIVKPLLMITLFWYYYTNTKALNNFFVTGLGFSFLGDVLLLGNGEIYFILGLLFFLIAHLSYILMVIIYFQKTTFKQVIIASLPYTLIFILLLTILYDGLGAMRIPVIVYAITISVFGIVSLILYIQNKSKASLLLVIGVLIFITSDSVLALNMFYKKQSFYPLLIMITYVIAQYLICRFVLLYSKNIKLRIN